MGKHYNRLFVIEKYFIRYSYSLHLAFTLLFCLLSPAIVGFSNLDTYEAAKVMEIYFSLTGILLFSPLLIPEQDRSIRDLVRSKEQPVWQLLLMRFAAAVLAAAIVIFAILSIIDNSGGTICFGRLFAGSLAETLFLGSICFLAASLTGQIVLGYMAGFMYYAVNLGAAKYLGHFALFQMCRGVFDFIPRMAFLGVLMIVGGILYDERRQ